MLPVAPGTALPSKMPSIVVLPDPVTVSTIEPLDRSRITGEVAIWSPPVPASQVCDAPASSEMLIVWRLEELLVSPPPPSVIPKTPFNVNAPAPELNVMEFLAAPTRSSLLVVRRLLPANWRSAPLPGAAPPTQFVPKLCSSCHPAESRSMRIRRRLQLRRAGNKQRHQERHHRRVEKQCASMLRTDRITCGYIHSDSLAEN